MVAWRLAGLLRLPDLHEPHFSSAKVYEGPELAFHTAGSREYSLVELERVSKQVSCPQNYVKKSLAE